MTKLFENNDAVFISHKVYIDSLYKNVDEKGLQLIPNLFKILSQYKTNKHVKSEVKSITETQEESVKYFHLRKEQQEIKFKFYKFMEEFMKTNILVCEEIGNKEVPNEEALRTVEYFLNEVNKSLIIDAYGANIGEAVVKEINDSNYLFPENCKFYCKDVIEIEKYLIDRKYDLILLDPPWWNKYIRRKRKKSSDAYKMLYNKDLKNLPINKLLKDNGIVVVWCTNSAQNENDLRSEIFPSWQVEYISTWYWMKITTMGKPVCNFSMPPRKQPYERIIFGSKRNIKSKFYDGKLLVSVPSAIHSHKPPLVELLKPLLPENPSCLEIFARYLLPSWTSYGNEVLKLQHRSLYSYL